MKNESDGEQETRGVLEEEVEGRRRKGGSWEDKYETISGWIS